MSTRPALAPRPANSPSQSNSSSQRSVSASAGVKRSREVDGQDDERHAQAKRSRTDVFDNLISLKDDMSSRQMIGLERSRVDDASKGVGTIASAGLTNSASTSIATQKYAKSLADSILQSAFDAKKAKDKSRADDLARQAKEQEKAKSKADKEAARMEKERARIAKQQAEEEFRTKYRQAFPSWRFYFDGVSAEQRQNAGKRIETLGAVVEEFLSNKVTHFITPAKLEKENGNEKGKLTVPKGGLLKSPVDLKGAYNPLEKAKKWGCKIWDIAKLESVLDRTLAKPKTETPVTLQDIFTPAQPQHAAFITPSLNGSAQSGTSHAQSSAVFKQPAVQSTALKPSVQSQSTSLKVPSNMGNQIFSRPKGPLNPYGALPEQKRSFTVPTMFTPRPGTAVRNIDTLQLQRMRKLNDPSKALAGLLATEKATNMTMERDPYSRRHDWSYFAKGAAFVIVESLSSAWGLVGKLEWKAHFIAGVKKEREVKPFGSVYAKDAYSSLLKDKDDSFTKTIGKKLSKKALKEVEDDGPEYPVLYCDPRMRNPFQPWSLKQERKEKALEQRDIHERKQYEYTVRLGRAFKRQQQAEHALEAATTADATLTATPGRKPLRSLGTPGRPQLGPSPHRLQYPTPKRKEFPTGSVSTMATDQEQRASGFMNSKSMGDSMAGPPTTTTSFFSQSNLSAVDLAHATIKGVGAGGIVPGFGGVKNANVVEMRKGVFKEDVAAEPRGMQRTSTMPAVFKAEDALEASLLGSNAGVAGLRRTKSLLMQKEIVAETKEEEKKEKKPEGYCECCKEHYESLLEHVNSRRHRKFATDPRRYKDLDRRITHLQRVTLTAQQERDQRRQLARQRMVEDAIRKAEEESPEIPVYMPAPRPTMLESDSSVFEPALGLHASSEVNLSWLTDGTPTLPTLNSTSEDLDLSITSASTEATGTSECVTPLEESFSILPPLNDVQNNQWDAAIVISSDSSSPESKEEVTEPAGLTGEKQMGFQFPDPITSKEWWL